MMDNYRKNEDIDAGIRFVENQIRSVERKIEEYQFTLNVLRLVLQDLKGRKVVEEAEKIIREVKQ